MGSILALTTCQATTTPAATSCTRSQFHGGDATAQAVNPSEFRETTKGIREADGVEIGCQLREGCPICLGRIRDSIRCLSGFVGSPLSPVPVGAVLLLRRG